MKNLKIGLNFLTDLKTILSKEKATIGDAFSPLIYPTLISLTLVFGTFLHNRSQNLI
ncbi:MAG: hypothetical protein ACXVCN_06655 [Bdellovibrio sp.]